MSRAKKASRPSPSPTRRGSWRRRLLVFLALVLVVLPGALLLLYRLVPPPLTPLMVVRLVEGESLDHRPVPPSRISPHLFRALIAAEDAHFCDHAGFDFDALADAAENYFDGGPLRGASTIPMQTAKNLFLWPGRDFLRKGLEAWLTLEIEVLWPKAHILATYANIVEWGPGIYGAEAAARHHFGVAAADLNADQAARLAALLPAPRRRHPHRLGHLGQRLAVIRRGMAAAPVAGNGTICP